MKIALLLNNDIHCQTALDLLTSSLAKHQVKIILSNSPQKNTMPQQIVAMQQQEKCQIKKPEFVQEFSTCNNINDANEIADLQRFSPDLIISIRFRQILKNPDFFTLAPHGILNLHSGILPKYRGVLASFWSILKGEKNLGTTLHYISDAGIDTGDIVAFSQQKINFDLSLTTNINNLYQDGCALILQALVKIIAQEKITVIKQNTLGSGQYFSLPKQDDVDTFLKKMRLI